MAKSATSDYGSNNVNAGRLPGMLEICIDHFMGTDLESTAFFLSHAHTDHMAGLDTEAFMKRLKEPGVKLYCQMITPILLSHWDSYLGGSSGIENLIRDKKIVPLDAESEKRITIPAKPCDYFVDVTLLPAGHCPGSVMFLFENSCRRILYTADCRISVDDLKQMSQLHVGIAANRTVKKIDHLLIDSTFCSFSASAFPDRKFAFEKAIENIDRWMKNGEKHYLKLSFAARFAHEFIIIQLYDRFRKKIHVPKSKYEIYEQIPRIEPCVTLDANTPFHLCDDKECFHGKKQLVVRLACQWFTKVQENSKSPVSYRSKNYMQVCYSMHSSLEEIGQMIDYLQPAVVTPLVKPLDSTMADVEHALRSSTTWKFEYEDYRTSKPECTSDDDHEPFQISLKANKSSIKQLEETISTPSKRYKSSESNSKWNFPFSPSPVKGASPGNSQEVVDRATNDAGTSKAARNLDAVWRNAELHENDGF